MWCLLCRLLRKIIVVSQKHSPAASHCCCLISYFRLGFFKQFILVFSTFIFAVFSLKVSGFNFEFHSFNWIHFLILNLNFEFEFEVVKGGDTF